VLLSRDIQNDTIGTLAYAFDKLNVTETAHVLVEMPGGISCDFGALNRKQFDVVIRMSAAREVLRLTNEQLPTALIPSRRPKAQKISQNGNNSQYSLLKT
jgi:hypothetical protein